MWLRLLIIAVLAFFVYRKITRFLASLHAPSETGPPQMTDTMVQDPVCRTYLPRNDALTLRHGGKTVYFCSEKCRNAFLKEKTP
ncbi:MAG: TRASH domain protein [Desulfobacterales bacterium]|nr:MAG: TRASH domain protein [Desulfobacterales bacterium]